TSGGPACQANARPGPRCDPAPRADSACKVALADPDWFSEGRDLYDAPHAQPLRLARSASVAVAGAADVDRAWAPRLASLPLSGADMGAPGTDPLLGVFTIYGNPRGYHVWLTGDACRAFDHAAHASNLLVRYLATEGRDLYVVSHPASHGCLADSSCPFFK
ncbi:MAG TPA: hypothetical protein PLR99_32975, partial [Polyangiaceae bacterium]|nr:hypothetical protein [Polyangiaceae bacterium]